MVFIGGKCRQGGLRNKEVLHEIIKRVTEGTAVYTDCWKGYYGLEMMNFDWAVPQ